MGRESHEQSSEMRRVSQENEGSGDEINDERDEVRR